MKTSSLAGIFLFFLVYIGPLGVRPIIIPDESRYGEIPREMIASGDWVVPRLNGLRYFEKPVLGYWANAGSMILFGENAFAIRFSSAMAAGLSALMLFFVGRKFAGGQTTGVLAAAVFLTFLEVYAVSTFSVLDGLFSLFMTGTLVMFFSATMEDRAKKKTGLLAVSGIFCGLAFLTKGFLVFALFLVVVVPFMGWERRWKELFRVCWIPILAAVVVSLPWAVLIHIREPDFWHYFFWNEHIRRFLAENAQHKESVWYFFLLLPGAALPWTFLLPAAALGLKKDVLVSPIVRFALCWFLFPFLFFTVSSGKLLTYILPCFPPLAILTATGLLNYLKKGRKKAFSAGVSALALMTGIGAVTLLVIQMWGPPGLGPYTQPWKWLLAVAGLLSWGLCSLMSIRTVRPKKKIALYAAAPLLFLFAGHFILPGLTIEHKAPGDFLMEHVHRIRPACLLVSDETTLRAVSWFYKRSDVYLLGSTGELSYGLGYGDSKHRLLNMEQFRELVLRHRGSGRVTLVASARKFEAWKDRLPEPRFEDVSGRDGFVIAQF